MATQYRPQLDGIRGLAVLAVVSYHATSLAPGGWLGVDVFFVLSGYLITGLLIGEHERHGRIDLRSFYIRRGLRLGPALLVALAVSVPIMLAFPTRELDYSPIAVVGGVLFYASNWLNVAHPVGLGPLTHTWSLAIEEQFYLLWPLVLVLMHRRGMSRARMATWCGGAIVALIALRAGLTPIVDHRALWFASTSRADSLLIGALVALLAPLIRKRIGNLATIAAAAILGVACLVDAEFSTVMLVGGLTGIALVGGVFIIGGEFASVGRVLIWAPLRAVGMVSYGLYLFHYPVFFFANYAVGLSGPERWGVKILGSAGLTVGSYFLVEKPALRLKKRFQRSEMDDFENTTVSDPVRR